MMNKYLPFLKLKVNEVGALKTLASDIKAAITPFFDFPQKAGMTEDIFVDMVAKAVRKISSNLSDYPVFFLDNYDIGDHVTVGGKDNYSHIIDAFAASNFIPVVGLDRAPGRNKLVLDQKRAGNILADTIALRLQVEDFEDFDLVVDEIGDLADEAGDLFENWILILDNRVCFGVDVAARIDSIVRFIGQCCERFDFDEIVIAGSSIPASIKDIVSATSVVRQERSEISIYQGVVALLPNFSLTLGDYTIVSPLYSDLDIPPEAMRNVTAPKITYSYSGVHYIERGGSLKSHARGPLQYNDIARNVVGMSFFRGNAYSAGDKFLFEKANLIGSSVTPSSILNPTINAHITFMCKDFAA
jgi:hypothetical protein